jgi:uncharacterized membrane protein
VAHTHAGSAYGGRPFADRVRHVGPGAPFAWFAAGWRDFRASLGASLAYGMIFVLAGMVLTATLFAANMIYLFVPLAAGFMLVGPAATLGFYAISRDLEAARRPTFAGALLAYRTNPGPMLYVGFALLSLFLVWLRLVQLVFALTFPTDIGPDAPSLLQATLFTADGQMFLAIMLAMGAVMAALTFAGAAFALPLLLDRPVGMVEAVATSWTAVEMNLWPMLVWAVLLVLLTVAGMAAGIVGLAVTLPLAGHATWHAYRAVVRPAGSVT